MSKVVVYIPVFNNADWCRRFIPNSGFDYIVSDNASTDGSGDFLAAKGLTVIRQKINLGRTGNWEYCFRHFQASGRPWVKLHMAGDELSPDAAQIFEGLLTRHPDARFVAASCEIVRNIGEISRFGPTKDEEMVSSVEAVRRIALKGNWLGLMLTTFIHRDALAGSFSFGDLPWIADLRFYLWIVQRFPVLCSSQIVGQLVVHPNRLHAKWENSFRARSEEGIVRSEAAEVLRRLTNSTDEKHAAFLQECQLSWEDFVSEHRLTTPNEKRQLELATTYAPMILAKAMRNKLLNRFTKLCQGSK